jgi:WD40 repeat protein
LYDPSTGTWNITGSLNQARSFHTAMLLPDGKVLVVGRSSATTELYDPSTGTWSITGSLNVPRDGHTATLLANGKVLVAGGFANSCCLQSDLTNTAELYDPATGEWSFTGNLNVPRRGHTATLLANGKVLVAGGGTTAELYEELYDPATGKWSLTGTLSGFRVRHKATLLQDGKVLVAGGCVDGECFLTAELYDPNTETWSITGSPNTPRDIHTLTLLPNGNVLLSGGEGQCCPYIRLDTAELYNPATGRWSYTGSLNTSRVAHTATLLPDGKVLIAGGADNTAELYDTEALGPAPTVLPRIISASVSGKKLLITGENFHAGAVILLNGEEQKSKNQSQNPQTRLIGKKAGKKIKAGDRLQVRNPDGTTSEEFIFSGS